MSAWLSARKPLNVPAAASVSTESYAGQRLWLGISLILVALVAVVGVLILVVRRAMGRSYKPRNDPHKLNRRR